MTALASEVRQAPPLEKATTAGNYFVANYPPFAVWTKEGVADFQQALDREPVPGTPLGLYVHIPFCRKRCHFCYFRVYTDKNSTEIRAYLDAVLRELELVHRRRFVGGRRPEFLYFGGGTPSYLSVEQFTHLADGMRRLLPWDGLKEFAVEGEPGTLTDAKLRALRELGVTRLSLGIEHFDDGILELNGRAHRSKEVYRAYNYAREIGFDQINIDLIAGMLGERGELWTETVGKALELKPDSVTIYQMEVPYNTTLYQRMREAGSEQAPVADWDQKRAWVDEAFRTFCADGYSVAAATTVVRDATCKPFLYRKGLFDGSDLLSLGVSAFGHVGGVNYQNQHDFQPYVAALADGRLPTFRAHGLTREQQYIREFSLQLKNGSVEVAPFERKFGESPHSRFSAQISYLRLRGHLDECGSRITLTREALLQVDLLLREFFLPEHRTGRYA